MKIKTMQVSKTTTYDDDDEETTVINEINLNIQTDSGVNVGSFIMNRSGAYINYTRAANADLTLAGAKAIASAVATALGEDIQH